MFKIGGLCIFRIALFCNKKSSTSMIKLTNLNQVWEQRTKKACDVE